ARQSRIARDHRRDDVRNLGVNHSGAGTRVIRSRQILPVVDRGRMRLGGLVAAETEIAVGILELPPSLIDYQWFTRVEAFFVEDGQRRAPDAVPVSHIARGCNRDPLIIEPAMRLVRSTIVVTAARWKFINEPARSWITPLRDGYYV